MKPLADCSLYTFVDTAYLHGRPPDEITRQLCDNGSDLIQFRAKDWPLEQIERTAETLLEITQAAKVRLVINDQWELALRIGAPFCHLGQEDFFDAGYTHASQLPRPPQEHHRPNPAGRPRGLPQLGLSTHAPGQAERAIAAGADYIAIGPVYRTGTKPSAAPVTLEYVRWAAAHVPIPWFAIGGITLENLEEVLAAGARRIAVVSAILQSEDIGKRCAAFKSKLTQLT